MDKKKSLGSSPIGYSGLSNNSYNFIRDLGVSSKTDRSETEKKSVTSSSDYINGHKRSDNSGNGADSENREKDKQVEKKIVSYYLEIELIDRIKNIADEEGMYYSSIVSKAIEAWMEQYDG